MWQRDPRQDPSPPRPDFLHFPGGESRRRGSDAAPFGVSPARATHSPCDLRQVTAAPWCSQRTPKLFACLNPTAGPSHPRTHQRTWCVRFAINRWLNPGLAWWLSGKKSALNAGDMGSVPESGRSPGGGVSGEGCSVFQHHGRS